MKKLLSIILMLLAFKVNAATITLSNTETSLPIVTYTGKVVEEDTERFYKITKNLNRAIVILNSRGGDPDAALKIGTIIHQKNFITYVPDETICASACALIWLSGAIRFMERTSAVGFHSAYYVDDLSPANGENAITGAVLREWGLSYAAVYFVTNHTPPEIEWLTPRKAQEAGIVYYYWSDFNRFKKPKSQ